MKTRQSDSAISRVNCFQKKNNKTRKVINWNLYEDHLSYISKLNTYCKKFERILCGRLFGSSTNQSKHTKVCDKATKLKFQGGYFAPQKSIFEKLNELDMC